LSDDDFRLFGLTGSHRVWLYGQEYASFYVGSNGYVTFGAGDADWSETIDEHFDSPARVAACWTDFDPTQGGRINVTELDDRVAVTWESIHEVFFNSVNTFQLELYYNGDIAITFLNIEAADGLVGISQGLGVPIDFVGTDLTTLEACVTTTCYVDGDGDSYGDVNDPGQITLGANCGVGWSANNMDCDDALASVYTGAPELLDDGIDQDCDGYDATCCAGTVGDANNDGSADPTIGDISALIDHLFITANPLTCYPEADANQSGGLTPTSDDITIADISALIDFLFISGGQLPSCLNPHQRRKSGQPDGRILRKSYLSDDREL
jgi:hypothetical protein